MPRLSPIALAAVLLALLFLAPTATTASARSAAGSAGAGVPIAHIAQEPVPPVASDAPPPNDPGKTTVAGGWRAIQWNFLAPNFGIDVEPAWARLAAAGRPGAQGIVVAVLDTGVAYANHGKFRRSPDLVGTRFARGYDFVDDDPYPDDHNGHGTHVASTIAERTNNGLAVTGIAYGATIMPVRVLDTRGEGDANVIARGVRWAADHGADVINLSLEFPGDVKASEIGKLLRAMRSAYAKGIVIVAASGNEAGRAIAYPARAGEVISVGATTEHGCLSDFSNEGRGLDIVAPGGGADADLAGDDNCRPNGPPGEDIYQMTFLGTNPGRFGLPSGYDGTSMAVPHVSGILALIVASGVLGPHPTPAQLLARLKSTARDLGAPGYDRRYGSGLVNANAATAPAPAPMAVRRSVTSSG
ncbi:MAG: family serine peptidase [Solirubrobacterales bacterium]|nr:family serine peptidase [Solirubrobacterales bacterium]